MARCEDCGKFIIAALERRKFLDYIQEEYDDDSDVDYGSPLCFDCYLNTYEEIIADIEDEEEEEHGIDWSTRAIEDEPPIDPSDMENWWIDE